MSRAWQLHRHQEIKACVELLLELAIRPLLPLESKGDLILSRLYELQRYSQQAIFQETYHPLLELKHYLEKTTISYREETSCLSSISLDCAVATLNTNSHRRSSCPLWKAVIEHVREEIKPSQPLYTKLKEVWQHQSLPHPQHKSLAPSFFHEK